MRARSATMRHTVRLSSGLPSLTRTISWPPGMSNSSSAATNSPTLAAPLYTGTTIDSAKAGSGAVVISMRSGMGKLFLHGNSEKRATKRPPQTASQQRPLNRGSEPADRLEHRRLERNVAGFRTARRQHFSGHHHQRKQDRIPISCIDQTKPRRAQQSGNGMPVVAADVGDRDVMARQHPAIGGQVQDQQPFPAQAAMELPQGHLLIYIAMAQDVRAEDRRED